uniref:Uncharacterized protein n=1 Tax=Macrostomum lignano TaxID=282301 RepID=A0A1I8JPC4_9PLAT
MVCGPRCISACGTAPAKEDYDKLRPLSYPETDVFLVCFSVGQQAVVCQRAGQMEPELRQHAPQAPLPPSRHKATCAI